MRCQCGGSSNVTDSRTLTDSSGVTYIRRRRVCGDCGNRFSTGEVILEDMKHLLSVKKESMKFVQKIGVEK